MSTLTAVAVAITIVFVIVWIVAGVYITQANVKLSDYKNDGDQAHRAYWTSFWAAFTTWTLVGVVTLAMVAALLLGTVLFATGVGEAEVAVDSTLASVAEGAKKAGNAATPHASKIAITILVASISLASLTGILAAITAVNTKNISTYDSDTVLQKAHKEALTASLICLSTVAAAIITAIGYAVYISRAKKKAVDEHKEEVQSGREFLLQYEAAKNKQTTSGTSLPQYASSSSLPQYASNSSLPQYASSTSLPQYASSSSLPQYASSSSVPSYASSTPVPSYASSTPVPSYASSTPVPSYAVY